MYVMLAQSTPISYHTEANGCIFFTTGVVVNLSIMVKQIDDQTEAEELVNAIKK